MKGIVGMVLGILTVIGIPMLLEPIIGGMIYFLLLLVGIMLLVLVVETETDYEQLILGLAWALTVYPAAMITLWPLNGFEFFILFPNGPLMGISFIVILIAIYAMFNDIFSYVYDKYD